MTPDEVTPLLFCCFSILLLVSATINLILVPLFISQNRKLKTTRDRLSLLSASALEDMRLQWLTELPHHTYRNELEIEVKFIYPMLRFLGYTANDLQVRVSVPIQVGRQTQTPAADWVILKNGRPFFVIEAKKHNQELSDEVLAQARSYAYGLNLNLYVVTNGRTLEVYSRGNENDSRVLHVPINEIDSHWHNLKQLIGKQ